MSTSRGFSSLPNSRANAASSLHSLAYHTSRIRCILLLLLIFITIIHSIHAIDIGPAALNPLDEIAAADAAEAAGYDWNTAEQLRMASEGLNSGGPVNTVPTDLHESSIESVLAALDAEQDREIDATVHALREKMDAEREAARKQFQESLVKKKADELQQALEKHRAKHESHDHDENHPMRETVEEMFERIHQEDEEAHRGHMDDRAHMAAQQQDLTLRPLKTTPDALQRELDYQFPEGIPSSHEAARIQLKLLDPSLTDAELDAQESDARHMDRLRAQWEEEDRLKAVQAAARAREAAQAELTKKQEEEAFFPEFDPHAEQEATLSTPATKRNASPSTDTTGHQPIATTPISPASPTPAAVAPASSFSLGSLDLGAAASWLLGGSGATEEDPTNLDAAASSNDQFNLLNAGVHHGDRREMHTEFAGMLKNTNWGTITDGTAATTTTTSSRSAASTPQYTSDLSQYDLVGVLDSSSGPDGAYQWVQLYDEWLDCANPLPKAPNPSCCNTTSCPPGIQKPLYTCVDTTNNNAEADGMCAGTGPANPIPNRECDLPNCPSVWAWVEDTTGTLGACQTTNGGNQTCCTVPPYATDATARCAGVAYLPQVCKDQFGATSTTACTALPPFAPPTPHACQFTQCPWSFEKVWDPVTGSTEPNCLDPTQPTVTCSDTPVSGFKAPIYDCVEATTMTPVTPDFPGCDTASLPNPVPTGPACQLKSCSGPTTYTWQWSSYGTCQDSCTRVSTQQCISSDDVIITDPDQITSLCPAAPAVLSRSLACIGGSCKPTWVAGTCQATCTKDFSCQTSTGLPLQDTTDITFCTASTKPATASCYTDLCQLRWAPQTDDAVCTIDCNSLKGYECVYLDGFPYVFDDDICTNNLLAPNNTKPAAQLLPCTDGYCRTWQTGQEYACDTNCQGTRWVNCEDSMGSDPIPDADAATICGANKPSSIRSTPCADGEGECLQPYWNVEPADVCPASCVKSAVVTCAGSMGVVDDSQCSGTKPSASVSCHTDDCVASWQLVPTPNAKTDGWSPCDASCTSTRSYVCQWTDGSASTSCDALTLDTTRDCALGEDACPSVALVYEWQSNVPFGTCSQPCGTGQQTRTVNCTVHGTGNQVPASRCAAFDPPVLSQDCNTQDCPDLCVGLSTTCGGCIKNAGCGWCGSSIGTCNALNGSVGGSCDAAATRDDCVAIPPIDYDPFNFNDPCSAYSTCAACGATGNNAAPCQWCPDDDSPRCISPFVTEGSCLAPLVPLGATTTKAGCPALVTTIPVDGCLAFNSSCEACTNNAQKLSCTWCGDTGASPACAKSQGTCDSRASSVDVCASLNRVDVCPQQTDCDLCVSLPATEDCVWCPGTRVCSKTKLAGSCKFALLFQGQSDQCSVDPVPQVYDWSVDTWLDCDATCTQKRSVVCQLVGGFDVSADGSRCSTPAPASTQSCFGVDSTSKCKILAPVAAPPAAPFNCDTLSTCATCRKGGEADSTDCGWANVAPGVDTCVSKATYTSTSFIASVSAGSGTIYPHAYGTTGVSDCPVTTRIPATYSWQYSDWPDVCPKTCNETRTATCLSDAGEIDTTGKCGTAVLTQTCTGGLCVVDDACTRIKDCKTCITSTNPGVAGCTWCAGTGACHTTGAVLAASCAAAIGGNLIAYNAPSAKCNAPVATPVYQWTYTAWKACTVGCSQSRTAQCASQFAQVDNSFCASLPTPVTDQPCSDLPCPGDLCSLYSDKCSLCLGMYSSASKTTKCGWCPSQGCMSMDKSSNCASSIVPWTTGPEQCPAGASSTPSSTQTNWIMGTFSSADEQCFSFRDVTCQDEYGATIDNSNCPADTKPVAYQLVQTLRDGTSCVPVVDCISSDDGTCVPQTCAGTDTDITCTLDPGYYARNGITMTTSLQNLIYDMSGMNSLEQDGLLGDYTRGAHLTNSDHKMHTEAVSSQYIWQTGAFGACTLPCGMGRKTRTVQCIVTATKARVSALYCRSLPVPPIAMLCNTQACSVYVSTTGADSNSGVSVTTALGSIVAALKLMTSPSMTDNTIILSPGLYNATMQAGLTDPDIGPVLIQAPVGSEGSVVFDGGNIDFVGTLGSVAINMTNKNYPLYLRGITYQNYFGTVILIDNSEVVLENCFILNSTSGIAPSIVVRNGGKLSILNSHFSGSVNIANGNVDGTGRGGLMYVSDSQVQITSSVIADNRASLGGAIYLDSGATLALKNCSLHGNAAVQGGAIYAATSLDRPGLSTLAGGVVRMLNTIVRENWVDNYANLLQSVTNSSSLVVERMSRAGRSLLTAPTALTSGGGAAYFAAGSQLIVSQTAFRHNNANLGNGGALQLRERSKVSIQRARFEFNAAYVGKGGAIYGVATTLSMSNAQLSFNIGANGGSVYTSNSIFSLSNSVLSDSSAYSSTSDSYGGAFYQNGGSTMLISSQFQRNTATSGAGIFASNCVGFSITQSFVSNNIAAKSGGGFMLQNCPTTISAATVVQSNSAKLQGGGIYAISDATADYSLVISNHVYFALNIAELSNGGAIYANTLTRIALSNNVTFQSNTAASGGALYLAKTGNLKMSCGLQSDGQTCLTGLEVQQNSTVGGNTTAIIPPALFSSSGDPTGKYAINFYNNAALIGGGGAIFVSSISNAGQDQFLLRGVRMTDNNASTGGGAMVFQAAQPSIYSSFFTRNQAGVRGGALYTDGSIPNVLVTAMNSVFTNNNANLDGGAIYFQFATSNITSNTFDSNIALNGGSIAMDDCDNVFAVSNTFTNNLAANGGCAYYRRTAISGSSNSYSQNTAINAGGAMVLETSNAHVSDGTMRNNVATDGGAISMISGTTLILNNMIVSRNNASSTGGGIRTIDSTIVVALRSAIRRNNAGNLAGAIHSSNSIINITDGSSLQYNTARNNAGALTLTLLTNATFYGAVRTICSDNVAGSMGGCASVRDSSTIRMTNAACENNIAQANAGCITLFDSADGSLISSSISNNQAQSGGAFNVESSATLRVRSSTVTLNSAQESGGIIYSIDGSYALFTDCTMTNNTALINGGAIFTTTSANITVRSCTAEYNSARTGNGGFAYPSSGALLVVQSSTIQQNYALTGHGGALYLPNPAALIVRQSTFVDNEALTGGAIAMDWRVTTYMANTTFTANVASSHGGALHLSGVFPASNCSSFLTSGSFQLIRVSFASNVAKTGGGGVAFLETVPAGDLPQGFTVNEADAFVRSPISDASNPYQPTSVASCFLIRTLSYPDNTVKITANTRKIATYTFQESFCQSCSMSTTNTAFYGGLFASSSMFPNLDSVDGFPSLTVANNLNFPVQVSLWDDFQNKVTGTDADGTQMRLSIVQVDETGAAANASTTDSLVLFAGTGTVLSEIALTTDSSDASTTFSSFSFANVYVSGDIGSSFAFTATSVANTALGIVKQSTSETFTIASCSIGEKRVGQTCLACGSGTYNLNGDGHCYICPASAICPTPIEVLAKENFWQDPTIDMTSLHLYGDSAFYQCATGFCCAKSEGCAMTSSTDSCSNNRSGILCSRCPSGQVGNDIGQCFNCNPKWWPLFTAAMGFGPAIGQFILYSPNPDTLFPIFLTFFQLLPYAVGPNLNSLDVFNLNIVGTANANDACIYPLTPLQEITSRYAQVLVVIVWYAFWVGLIQYYRVFSNAPLADQSPHFRWLNYWVQRALWFLTRVVDIKCHFVFGAIRVYVFLYTAIADTSLTLLSCRTVAGISVLDSAPDTECWKGEHLLWGGIALFLMIFYVILTPLILVAWVYLRTMTKSGSEFCRITAIESGKWGHLHAIEMRTEEQLKIELKSERAAAKFAEKFYTQKRTETLRKTDPLAFSHLESKMVKQQADMIDVVKRRLNWKKTLAIDYDLDYYEQDEEGRILQDSQDCDAMPIHYWTDLSCPFNLKNQLFFFFLFFRRLSIVIISLFIGNKEEMNAVMALTFYLNALFMLLRDPYLDFKANLLDHMCMIGLGVICSVEIAANGTFIQEKYITGVELTVIGMVVAVGLWYIVPTFIPPIVFELVAFRKHEKTTAAERLAWEERYAAAKTPAEKEELLEEREKSRQTVTVLARKPIGFGNKIKKRGKTRVGARGARRRR